MKRLLFLTHRWMGITLCLFMAMWFFSGVVMMYVGYPKLTSAERLDRLHGLDPASCCISTGEAIKAAGMSGNPKEMRITSVANTPYYVMMFDKQQYVAVNAKSGSRIGNVSASEAIDAAIAFSNGSRVAYQGLVQEDAWTHSKGLDPYRPLHRIQVEDSDQTMLYVSSVTGEVVRDATQTERMWNWVGAWIHWLYPFRGGALDQQHTNIVVYTSLIATILAISGLVVGIMRWRLRGRYSNASRSPYRTTSMRWHHMTGLVFGLVAITWIFSGMMSMNPWKVFTSSAAPLDLLAFQGGVISGESFPVDLHRFLERYGGEAQRPRELEFRMFDGKGYIVELEGAGRTRINPALGAETSLAVLPLSRLQEVGARLIPGAHVAQAEILSKYDFYYYARAPHTMSGHLDKRLPVIRLKFDDPDSTWVHLDPYTGAVIGKIDGHRRASRWLFALLHSWDWLPLLDRRPLWDVLLILFSVGGFLISMTGALIAWRRLTQISGQGSMHAPAGTDHKPNPK